jgi:hypothetical protein
MLLLLPPLPWTFVIEGAWEVLRVDQKMMGVGTFQGLTRVRQAQAMRVWARAQE